MQNAPVFSRFVRQRHAISVFWLCSAVCWATLAAHADPVYNPVNGHYYERVNKSGLSWQQAKVAAASQTYKGLKGHLVTISSAAENAFVFSLGNVIAYHFGAYQDTSAADYHEPSGGWRWVTGETFAYTNWSAGEPNNGGGGPGKAENYMVGWSGNSWNDGEGKHEAGYVVEYEKQLFITGVPDDTSFRLGQATKDGRSIAVPLRAFISGSLTGKVSWSLDLTYTSPITNQPFDYAQSIDLTGPQCVDTSYPIVIAGMGGTLTLTASAKVDGQAVSDKVTCTIIGYASVPTSGITKVLLSGYGPLLTGLADTESGYYTEGKGQFDRDGRPVFSVSSGGQPLAVGLMQIYMVGGGNSAYDLFGTYWDWTQNAQEGIDIFKYFVGQAKVRARQASPKAWVQPTTSQIENWAVALYKGIAGNQNPYVYDPPTRSWVVNPAWARGTYNSGTTYKATVNSVRQRAKAITGDPSVDGPGTEMP